MSSPTWVQAPEVYSSTRARPHEPYQPLTKPGSPIAILVPSELSDTDVPALLWSLAPSTSAPTCDHAPVLNTNTRTLGVRVRDEGLAQQEVWVLCGRVHARSVNGCSRLLVRERVLSSKACLNAKR